MLKSMGHKMLMSIITTEEALRVGHQEQTVLLQLVMVR